MDKQELQPLKGFRDFLPAQASKRNYALDIIRETFSLFGFEPLETPALERQSLLLGKYGTEADKLVYKFEDEGKRKIGLRYDQTVPTARVIAAFQGNLGLPFKRYQIQPVWRAEKPQKGRYREFLQCDIDIFGTTSPTADAEIIATTVATARNLGFKKLKVLINSRSILFGLIESAKIDEKKALTVIQSIDKLDKLSQEDVKKELLSKDISLAQVDKLFDLISTSKPTEELNNIISLATSMGLDQSDLVFTPTLARGLDYYTGPIFELVSEEYKGGSLAGGGRYDKLVGQLSGIEIPAVGLAIGFDRLVDAMDELGLFTNTTVGTKVLVTYFSPDLEVNAIEVATKLRAEKIATQLYLNPSDNIQKQLKYANKKNIPFAIIIGEQEAKDNTFTLKDLTTGEQQTLKLASLVATLTK